MEIISYTFEFIECKDIFSISFVSVRKQTHWCSETSRASAAVDDSILEYVDVDLESSYSNIQVEKGPLTRHE